jgi:hypothetical protein
MADKTGIPIAVGELKLIIPLFDLTVVMLLLNWIIAGFIAATLSKARKILSRC